MIRTGVMLLCFVATGMMRGGAAELVPAPVPFEKGGKFPGDKPEPAVPSGGTRIIPYTEVPCQTGDTLVWTAAMQLAFDRMLGAKGPMKLLKVEPENSLIARMRKFVWDEESVLPKGGWFAVAGKATPELAAEATEKWRALAGPAEEPFQINGPAGVSSYAAFAGIKRDFAFAREFYPSKGTLLEWGAAKTNVKFFGVAGEDAGQFSQVARVLAYRPDEKIQALEFAAKESDDRLILYTPSGGQTMHEAIQWMGAWRKSWPDRENASEQWNDKCLHATDDLRVPEISLERNDENLSGWFAGDLQLEGQQMPWRVVEALSSAKLEVDAKGVKFKAKASMQMRALGGPPPSPPKRYPRTFWFDRPFFLFLWREKAEWPYAAVWFGNADGLVK